MLAGVAVRGILGPHAVPTGAGCAAVEPPIDAQAQMAGLKVGGVVLSINVRENDEAIARMKPGDALAIAYWRDEGEHELNVTISPHFSAIESV